MEGIGSLCNCPHATFETPVSALAHWIQQHAAHLTSPSNLMNALTERLSEGTIEKAVANLSSSYAAIAGAGYVASEEEEEEKEDKEKVVTPVPFVKLTTSLAGLPPELLLMIFAFLPSFTRVRSAAQVCRTWHHFVRDEALWRVKTVEVREDATDIQLVEGLCAWQRECIQTSIVRVLRKKCRTVEKTRLVASLPTRLPNCTLVQKWVCQELCKTATDQVRLVIDANAVRTLAESIQRFPKDEEIQNDGLIALTKVAESFAETLIAAAPVVISVAVNALVTHQGKYIQEYGSWLIGHLCQAHDGRRRALGEAGAVAAVIGAMQRLGLGDSTYRTAMHALCCLVFSSPENVERAVAADGINATVALARRRPDFPELQLDACSTLWNVYNSCVEYTNAVVDAGGAEVMMAAATRHASVIDRACGALSALAKTDAGAARIASYGDLSGFATAMRNRGEFGRDAARALVGVFASVTMRVSPEVVMRAAERAEDLAPLIGELMQQHPADGEIEHDCCMILSAVLDEEAARTARGAAARAQAHAAAALARWGETRARGCSALFAMARASAANERIVAEDAVFDLARAVAAEATGSSARAKQVRSTLSAARRKMLSVLVELCEDGTPGTPTAPAATSSPTSRKREREDSGDGDDAKRGERRSARLRRTPSKSGSVP